MRAETEALPAQRAEQLQAESEAQRVEEDYTATQARLDDPLNQWVTLGAE